MSQGFARITQCIFHVYHATHPRADEHRGYVVFEISTGTRLLSAMLVSNALLPKIKFVEQFQCHGMGLGTVVKVYAVLSVLPD
jgi:hypothetical protein